MITWLAGMLMAKKPGMTLSYASKIVKIGLGAVAVIALVIGFLLWLNGREEAAVDDYKAGVEAQAAPARETAADHRLEDALVNQRNEGDLHNAIDKAPPSAAGMHPADHALACERLRKLGRVPAACRPPVGYGTEARPN